MTCEAAKRYTEAGLHILPIKGDGSKAPSPAARYAEAMDLRPGHTVLFFLASLGLTGWFLYPLLNGFGRPPLWVFLVSIPPVLVWVVAVLPKHYRVVYAEPGLKKLLSHPLLMARCCLAALRPRPDSSVRPWLLGLYYLSLTLPVAAALVTLAVGLSRRA